MYNRISECIFHYAIFVGKYEIYEAKWTLVMLLFI